MLAKAKQFSGQKEQFYSILQMRLECIACGKVACPKIRRAHSKGEELFVDL